MMIWYTVLIAAVAAERIAELLVSRSNARWSFARGGVEHGRSHFAPMVALHVALLAGCLLEAWIARPEFLPLLGWPMLGVVLASQGLRWWCIGSLGRQWNTRVIVVPGASPVTRGPYRVLRHPNYLAVVAEGAALPLVHSAWVTALAFTVLNAVLLLRFRIPCEDRALRQLADGASPAADAPGIAAVRRSGER